MELRNPKTPNKAPRVQGTLLPGTHPADRSIRVERTPYAAPSPVENVLYWLIGAPIKSSLALHERLTKIKALAVFSSDALSSVAYATEEIMLVLVLAGAGVLSVAPAIAIVIAVLLFIVALSYNQTIHAYPSGGGAYIVAKDNLGSYPGLIAGAALLIDYVLTVAVSVSAGVAAIVSALPQTELYRVEIAVASVLLIAIANLRGLRESSTLFMAPTYFFVATICLLIISGLYRFFVLHDTSMAPTGNVLPTEAVEGLSLFLILRAFASGCTALTGVEAISNGVPAFKPPEAKNAARTLSVMAVILVSMFLGITLLARLYPVIPQPDHETVISQLGRTIFGEGPLYLFLQLVTTLILILAANTSFADFPRLSAIMARDGYLPHVFVRIGQRLVFSVGIVVLTGLSMVLIVAFGASTHNLIPLYALGVFTSFTLSQAGMVRHWWKLRGPNWRRSATINGVGAVATAVVLAVLTITKFGEGAYMVVFLVPVLVFAFTRIKKHYVLFQAQVQLKETDRVVEQQNIIVVPVQEVDCVTARALDVARILSGEVSAVHVVQRTGGQQPLAIRAGAGTLRADGAPMPTAEAGGLSAGLPHEAKELAERWAQAGFATPLQMIEAQSKPVAQALLAHIRQLGEQHPQARIVVMLPERAPRHFWDLVLHNQTSLRLKLALLFEPNMIVVSVPYDEQFEKEHAASAARRNEVIIPIARVDRAALRTLSFVDSLAGEKTAVFVALEPAEAQQVRTQWKRTGSDIPLVAIDSPFRSVTGPLIKYIDRMSQEQSDANIVVVVPEIIPRRRWQLLLHNQTVVLIKYVLLFRPRNRILISVPFRLAE